MILNRSRIAVLTAFFGVFLVAGTLTYSFPDFSDHHMAATRIASGQVLYRDHIKYLNVYHYPPVYLYTLGALYALVGSQMFAAKALLALSTVLTGVMLYVIVRELLDDRQAWLAAIFFLINPMTFIGVYGGYFDPFITFFVLVSLVLLLKGRSYSAGIALAIGVMSKPFALLLTPVVACYWWQTRDVKLWQFSAAFAVTVGVISLPFLVLAPEAYIRYALLYNFQRAAASLSLYYYFVPWLTNTIWTTVLPAAWMILVSIVFIRERVNRAFLLLEGVSLLLFGFLLLNRINYPHYLLYLTPFLSAVFAKHYVQRTSIAGHLVWQQLLGGGAVILAGAGLWAYPWFIGTHNFRSHPLFWIGATMYFLGSAYLVVVLLSLVRSHQSTAKKPDHQ